MTSAHILHAIAELTHEVNRAYCQATGDLSQLPWNVSPQWQKDSAIMGASAILENPSLSPADMHAKWMEQKVKDGWKYGPVKDSELREHPCMVPYEELPREQQVKDYLFRAVALTAAKHIK